MKLEVLNIVAEDDGSALMTVDMDNELLVALAKIGLLKVLTDAAEKTIKEHAPETAE